VRAAQTSSTRRGRELSPGTLEYCQCAQPSGLMYS
jgi:hypothetical protein